MPENLIGTLTLSILKSAHTSISPIIFYKLCSVATPEHPEPLLLENHVRIVALTPDLQRVSFYSVIDFLHHSSTTDLLSSLILIKELSELSGLTAMQGIVISLSGCCGVQISCKIATRICTSDQSETILVGAKQPRNIYVVISIIKP